MITPRIASLLLLLCSLTCWLGCSSQPAPQTQQPEQSAETPADPPPSEAVPEEVAPIELTEADNAALQKLIGQQEGKLVIVDFWATWCTTCMDLMPHTAQLQQQHANDLVVITMCLDDADKAPVAKEFLGKLDGEFTNLISAVGGGPKTLDEYELGDGIPHYKFYDREGKLAKVLDTDQERLATEESIDKAVSELLGGEAAAE